MNGFTRGFRLHAANGDTYDGAEFPSGRVVIDHADYGLMDVATSLDALLEVFPGARVERPEDER